MATVAQLLLLTAVPLSAQDPVDGGAAESTGAVFVPSTTTTNGALSLDQVFGYGSRVWFSLNAGESIAADQSFGTIGLFKPQQFISDGAGNEALIFFDGRFNYMENNVAGSLGLGYRSFFSDTNTAYGAHIFYDADNTRRSFFQQIGLGGEVRNDVIAANLNAYIPFGENDREYGMTPITTNASFQGRNILLERFRLLETALAGFEFEVGTPLSVGDHDVWAYLGYYFFDDDDSPEVAGIRARLRADLSAHTWLDVLLTNDDEHDTSVLVSLSWEFSGRFRNDDAGSRVRRSLVHPVARNQFAVVTENRAADPVVAVDATTGQPILVRHINSSAGAGGDGSIEAPLSTLTAASDTAITAPGELLFVHAGSVFNGESMTLQANQTLLGEGSTFTLNTAQVGNIPLPRATSSNVAPVINTSPIGGGIILADNTSVSGFNITNSTGSGVVADGVGGTVSVSDVTVSNSNRGIEIRNSAGSFTFDSLDINTTAQEGILLADNTAASSMTFTGTTVIDSASNVSFAVQGGAGTIVVNDLDITNRNSAAITAGLFGGTLTFNSALNIANPNGSLLEGIGIANSTGSVTFGDVTLDDTNRVAPGLATVVLTNNANDTNFGELNIATNNGGGISALNVGEINITGGVVNASGGIGVEFNGVSDLNAVFQSVSANNTITGLQVINSAGTGLTVTGVGGTPGSGGTIVATTNGVRLRVADNVNLNFMDITSGAFGLLSLGSNNVVLNGSTLTGTADGWTGIGVFNDANPNDGSPVIFSGNTIASTFDNTFGIHIQNDRSPQGAARIDGHTINLTGANTTGIFIEALDVTAPNGPGDIVLQSFQNNTVFATPGQEAVFSEVQATIFGQILVNGVPVP